MAEDLTQKAESAANSSSSPKNRPLCNGTFHKVAGTARAVGIKRIVKLSQDEYFSLDEQVNINTAPVYTR